MKISHAMAIAACGLGLSGCAGGPSWMPSFELPRGAPPVTTIQFESEPAGAEARTSTGAACQTPCALSVPAAEFTVTFTRQGYQSQTVPVQVSQSNEPVDSEFGPPAPRLVPSPVVVELQLAAAPPPRRRPTPRRGSTPTAAVAAPGAGPRPVATPRPAASAPRPAAARPATSVAPPPPPPPPAGASSSPWPPVPAR